MKVLLVGRPQLSKGGGGDKRVILKMIEYLKELDIKVSFTYEISPDYKGFDVAHLFTLSTYYASVKAKKYGIPYILSPIYDDCSDLQTKKFIFDQKPILFKTILNHIRHLKLKNVMNYFRKYFWNRNFSFDIINQRGLISEFDKRLHHKYIQIIDNASLLHYASNFARKNLESKFKINRPYAVFPWGVENKFNFVSSDIFYEKFKLKNFILCVSRTFGYRKNQLSLIKALKNTGYPVIVVANAYTFSQRFYKRRCINEGNKNIKFLSYLSEEELWSAYKAAKVFILPSLYESFGLVYFEAALAGCNIVATIRSPIKEYLNNLVWYCNPYDIISIK